MSEPAPTPRPERPRWRRRLLLAPVVGVGGLLLGVGAGLGFLATDPGNDVLRRGVLRLADGQLEGGVLELGGLRTRLVDGLTLTGLRLATDDGTTLVQADELAVTWQLGGLLDGRLRLPTVRLVGPQVDLSPGASGRLRMLEVLGIPPSDPDAPSQPWSGLGLDLLLPDLEIEGGRLAWEGGHVEDLGLVGAAGLVGADVVLRDVSAAGDLRGPLDRRVGVALDGGLLGGDLVVEEGEAVVGASRVRLDGRVVALETAPELEVRLSEVFLARAELSELAGGGAPAVDLAAEGAVSGPLSDLGAELRIDAGAGGRVGADLRADLAAGRPAWGGVLSGQDLDLGALYPEQAQLEAGARTLRLDVAGSGFSWPDGMAVHVRLAGREVRAVGEALPVVDAEVSIGAARVEVLGATVAHGAGTVETSGWLDLDAARGRLAGLARLPRLSRLEDLAGVELTGGATWQPVVDLAWADGVEVQASGPSRFTDAGTSGVTVGSAGGPLALAWRDETLEVDAPELRGQRVEVAGFVGEELGAALDVDWSAAAGASVRTEVEVRDLHGDAVATRIARLGGVVEVAAPPDGETRVDGAFDLAGLRATGPSGPASAGTLRLELDDGGLHASVDVAPEDEGGATLRAVVDQEGGSWRISDLLLAPTRELTVVSRAPVVVTPGEGPLPAVDAPLGGNAGQLQVESEGGERLVVTGRELDLGRWAELGRLLPGAQDAPSEPLPLAGTGAVDLVLEVTPDGTPRTLEGSADLAGLTVGEDLVDVDVQAGISGPLRRPELALDLSTDQGLVLTARGTLPVDLDAGWTACGEEADLRVVLAPVRAVELREHLSALPELAARASADLRVTGDACDPTLSLVAAADAPVGLDGEVVRLDLDLRREAGTIQVEGHVEEGFQRRLEVRGSAETPMGDVLAALREGEPERDLAAPTTWIDSLALNVVPLGVPLSTIRRFVELPPAIEGRVAGGLQLTGRIDAPVVQGALQLSGGRVGKASVESALLVLAPSDQGYTATVDARLRPDDAAEDAEALPLHVAADIPVTLDPTVEDPLAGEGLSVDLSGTFPLAALEGVVDGIIETEGVVEFSGEASGSLATPSGEVTATTSGAAFGYSPLGLRYSDISLDLVATEKRLVLRSLSVESTRLTSALRQAGSVSAQGSVELADLAPASARLQLDADRFWLIGESDMQIAASGQLQVSGDWPGLDVTGALQLAEGDMAFDETFFIGDRSLAVDDRLVIHRPSARREVAQRTPDEDEPPLWQGFHMELGIDLQRNLRLSARVPLQSDYGELGAAISRLGLDAELDGDVTVTQQDGEIALRGEVEPVRGTVSVLGSTFTLQDSTITFPGDGYDDPLLDIEAVKTLPDTEVGVEVTGRVSAFDIALSSPDYADQTDVVSLLLFGKPASEMGEEGQASSSLISSAVGALARGSVERALGNDVFDQFELDSTGQVRVGKAITDKLFLRYELNPTRDEQENLNEVTLEYLISRRLYAEFTTGDRGASSIDLFWRWRF